MNNVIEKRGTKTVPEEFEIFESSEYVDKFKTKVSRPGFNSGSIRDTTLKSMANNDDMFRLWLEKNTTVANVKEYLKYLVSTNINHDTRIGSSKLLANDNMREICDRAKKLCDGETEKVTYYDIFEWYAFVEEQKAINREVSRHMSFVKQFASMSTNGINGSISNMIARVIRDDYANATKTSTAADAMKLTSKTVKDLYDELKSRYRNLNISEFKKTIGYVESEKKGDPNSGFDYHKLTLPYVIYRSIELITEQSERLDAGTGDAIEKAVAKQFVDVSSTLFSESFDLILQRLKPSKFCGKKRLIELTEKCGVNVISQSAFLIHTLTLFRQIISTLKREENMKRFAFAYYSSTKGTGKSTIMSYVTEFLKKKGIVPYDFTYDEGNGTFSDPVFARCLLMTNDEIGNEFITPGYHKIIDNGPADYNIKYGAKGIANSYATILYCSNRRGRAERRLAELEFSDKSIASMSRDEKRKYVATKDEYMEFFEQVFSIALQMPIELYDDLGAQMSRINAENESKDDFVWVYRHIKNSSSPKIKEFKANYSINISALAFAICESNRNTFDFNSVKRKVKTFISYLEANKLIVRKKGGTSDEYDITSDPDDENQTPRCLCSILEIIKPDEVTWDDLDKEYGRYVSFVECVDEYTVSTNIIKEDREEICEPRFDLLGVAKQSITDLELNFNERNNDTMTLLGNLQQKIIRYRKRLLTEEMIWEIVDYLRDTYDSRLKDSVDQIAITAQSFINSDLITNAEEAFDLYGINTTENENNTRKSKRKPEKELSFNGEIQILKKKNDEPIEEIIDNYAEPPFSKKFNMYCCPNTEDGSNKIDKLKSEVSEFVLEADDTPMNEQLEILRKLQEKNLDFCTVYSGNKSLHFVFRLAKPVSHEIMIAGRKKFVEQLEKAGIAKQEIWDEAFLKPTLGSICHFRRRHHRIRGQSENDLLKQVNIEAIEAIKEFGIDVRYNVEKKIVEQKLVSEGNNLLEFKVKENE